MSGPFAGALSVLRVTGGRVVGHGVDIVAIDRLKRVYGRFGVRFLKKMLSAEELTEFASIQDKNPQRAATYMAGRWAAKEAAYKALGRRGIPFTELATHAGEHGEPLLSLRGRAKVASDEQGVAVAHLSIAHEDAYALASVILESSSEQRCVM